MNTLLKASLLTLALGYSVTGHSLCTDGTNWPYGLREAESTTNISLQTADGANLPNGLAVSDSVTSESDQVVTFSDGSEWPYGLMN